MPTSLPVHAPTLCAPAHWRRVDFVSDLHLQAGDQATVALWRRFLQRAPEQRADALFILGDLFEVWIGDDLLDPTEWVDASEDRRFWRACVAELQQLSRQTPIFFLPGNRDFLFGPQALAAAGMQALADPTVLDFLGQRWLLSHGDALCLADADYQRFRAQVRQPRWQQDFLARPLAEREHLARELRRQSQQHQHGRDPALWADVDAATACDWLRQSAAAVLIHGHTHRPGRHVLDLGRTREVLSDWCGHATPARAEYLRLDAAGVQRLTPSP